MAAQLAACTKEAEEAVRELQQLKIKSHTTTEEDMRIQLLEQTLTTASGRLARAQLCSQMPPESTPVCLRLHAHGRCTSLTARVGRRLCAQLRPNLACRAQLHGMTSS